MDLRWWQLLKEKLPMDVDKSAEVKGLVQPLAQ